MKRFVVIFVGTLFILLTGFLAGCGIQTISPEAHATNAYGTLAALSITPSPTATEVPSDTGLIQKLNDILKKGKVVDELSQTIDAKYQVLDVRFYKDMNDKIIYLQIDARCECINNGNCCTPERTFVVISNAMREVGKDVVNKMPDTITNIQIFCKNRDGLLIGTVDVQWEDMKGYVLGTVIGSQLGNRARVLPGQ
jgi:hypothetical protein